ncbi:MAG: hypothetical protein Phyf2KO_03210 [Phycisphaerales bacterium]
MNKEINIVRAVAPEDILVGTYVVELRRVHEVVNYCALFGFDSSDSPLIRHLATMPRSGPRFFRVEAVAIPFVFVKRPDGKSFVIDLRRSRLGVAPAPFGRAVFEAMSKDRGTKPDSETDTSTFPSAAD